MLAAHPAQAVELPAATGTLHLLVSGLTTTTGTLRLCVFTTPGNFPKCDKGLAVIKASAPASAPEVRIDIPGVPHGQIAISIFADLNDNRKLDKHMIVPAEPVGFSNNPTLMFGPPSFAASAITMGADTHTEITLKNF